MRYLMVVTVCLAGCGGGMGTDAGADLSGLPNHCANGKQDGDETDIDCGGSCPACATGRMCLRGSDCAFRLCVNNICVGGADLASVGDAAMADDALPVDATVLPDLVIPQDLTPVGCANNQQCMGLAHATGKCDQNGKCIVISCDPGFADCDKAAANGCEVSTDGDVANCGACGTSCAKVQNGMGACTAGKCAIVGCNPGFANCDNLFASGCATATAADIQNCGACGHLCTAPNGTPVCTAGVCTIGACNMGFADCDKNLGNGCEAQITSDPLNCGGCMKACMTPANSMAACANSACSVGACTMGFADCDKNAMNGCEANLLADVANCGQCGTTCPAVANATIGCKGGVCGIGMCDAQFGDCDMNPANGCEKSLATDAANCGACGMACDFANGAGACTNGKCGLTSCNTGFADCDMNVANGCETALQSNAMNCGKCANVCPMNAPNCVNAVCGVAEDFPPVYLIYEIELN